MTEPIVKFPQQITNISSEKQVILLTILAHRVNEDGEIVPLTKSQINAALANAEASLEVLDGTEVLGTSTAILLPDVDLEEGETMTLTVDTAIVKNGTTE